MIYSTYPAWVMGFHGCDQSVCNNVVRGNTSLQHSINEYDWLGHGIYFWENNPLRAYEFALEQKERGKIKDPAVVGAIIDLNNCLDMTDMSSLTLVSEYFGHYNDICITNGTDLPKNKGEGKDRPLRILDCAVIESLLSYLDDKFEPYDSVRGVFVEGQALFSGSSFRQKDHIQLCIRNAACIKGYFLPLLDIKAEYNNVTRQRTTE